MNKTTNSAVVVSIRGQLALRALTVLNYRNLNRKTISKKGYLWRENNLADQLIDVNDKDKEFMNRSRSSFPIYYFIKGILEWLTSHSIFETMLLKYFYISRLHNKNKKRSLFFMQNIHYQQQFSVPKIHKTSLRTDLFLKIQKYFLYNFTLILIL